MLADLISELNNAGIEVVWAMDLPCAGLWLAPYSLLIISASHPAEESVRACRHALLALAVSPAA